MTEDNTRKEVPIEKPVVEKTPKRFVSIHNHSGFS
jgi:hypothetical protein